MASFPSKVIATPTDRPTENWGQVPYDQALERQLALLEAVAHYEAPSTLVLVEHPPVYTIGRRREAARNLVADPTYLAARGISVFETSRGGDITYHGPGQLVAYPIMDLRQLRDLHQYLRLLEEVLIKTVAHFGITAGRVKGRTGIWCGDRKLAAIGVAVKQWVSYHGVALNVNPDLTHFGGIIPCGISDATVTSLAAEGVSPLSLNQVAERLTFEFWQIFRNIIPYGRI
jgi:lipoyl(octanoyl) transferase